MVLNGYVWRRTSVIQRTRHGHVYTAKHTGGAKLKTKANKMRPNQIRTGPHKRGQNRRRQNETGLGAAGQKIRQGWMVWDRMSK